MGTPENTPHYRELVKLTDEMLMVHLQHGQRDALAVLFDRHHRTVLNIALRILRDAGEAEDLMQSVFLEILRSAAQFDPSKGTTKVWILQYAYHRSFNRRSYLALRGIYDRVEEGDIGSAGFNPNPRSLGTLESSRLVQDALGSLNGIQRKVLELAFYEGLTMREISEKLGESFHSVRHNYYRSLEKLRSVLCEEQESPLEGRKRVSHAGP